MFCRNYKHNFMHIFNGKFISCFVKIIHFLLKGKSINLSKCNYYYIPKILENNGIIAIENFG